MLIIDALALIIATGGLLLLVLPFGRSGARTRTLAGLVGMVNGTVLALTDPAVFKILLPGVLPLPSLWLGTLAFMLAPITFLLVKRNVKRSDLEQCFAPPRVTLLEESVVTLSPAAPPDYLMRAIRQELENLAAQKDRSTFSVTMFSLDNALQAIQTEVAESMTADDERLKRFFLQVKSYEELTRIFGFESMSQQLNRTSTALTRYLSNLSLPWNPLFLSQELSELRKTVRHYLRINKALGHSLESAAEHWPSLKNFKHEDPITLLPEWAKAEECAKNMFENVAWSDLESTIRTFLSEKNTRKPHASSSALPLTISFDDRQKLRLCLSILASNSLRHGGGEVHVNIRNDQRHDVVTLRFHDEGRGLFVLGIQDKGETLAMQDYASRLLTSWRAPRGLATMTEELAKLGGTARILLFSEELAQGYCPFAIDITLPKQRLGVP